MQNPLFNIIACIALLRSIGIPYDDLRTIAIYAIGLLWMFFFIVELWLKTPVDIFKLLKKRGFESKDYSIFSSISDFNSSKFINSIKNYKRKIFSKEKVIEFTDIGSGNWEINFENKHSIAVTRSMKDYFEEHFMSLPDYIIKQTGNEKS